MIRSNGSIAPGLQSVIPGRERQLANPESGASNNEIPGSRFARPGMTL